MRFYAEQPSLTEAIRVAALCSYKGKRHPHQRQHPDILNEAGRRLQARQEELESCRTFDELFEYVGDVIGPIGGIGRHGVTAYDIATRIGAYLGLAPAYVYLHRGTREGARALGLRGEKLSRDQFPPAFHILTPAELENCLCNYKDELRAITGARSMQADRRGPQRGLSLAETSLVRSRGLQRLQKLANAPRSD
jgi:hypothetical protein